MIKDFILDTNVILHDCSSIFNFDDNNVIIPMTVIEELDHFKTQMNDLGRNARQFSRIVDDHRLQGSLVAGVTVNKQGGTLRVGFCTECSLSLLPREMDHNLADNKILSVALFLTKNGKNPAILVSKDTNLRIKADALGITAETYENGQVDFETLYTGAREIAEGDAQPLEELSPHEFVKSCSATDGSVLETLRHDKGLDQLVPLSEDLEAWGLIPRNEEQRCAMDILLNDDIKLVTLIGKAGTGKTLLALAAGLRKVTDDFVYKKLLVSRPVFPMGKDIGFLPGDVNEKLAPYLQPIYDNVEYLMSGGITAPAKGTKRKVRKSKYEEEKEAGMVKGHVELQAAGIMDIEPLLYIRGRSIPNVYMIIDEAQNLTPHEVKTIVTRAGVGTKLVFTGDPHQIDNPYVDASSNGLTYLVERFRGEQIAGHVSLFVGERSELAEIASNIL